MFGTIENSSPRSWRRWLASSRPARLLVVALAVAAVSGAAEGYVRIVLNGKKLHWSTQNISWKLNQAGSDNIADGSHKPAIEHAFQSWRQVTGSKLKFNFQGMTGSKNAGSSDHLVFFDENNGSGYFPQGSGTVAVTPISYNPANGEILDADIIFNGRDWNFSTDGSAGTFDVQDIATHEIGHFVGLDHSPVIASSMWPYVSTTQWLHRSLSRDDEAGAIAVAPSGVDGRLSGSLRRDDGSLLRGGMVAAVSASDGRLMASAASANDGDWVIRGLPTGDYHVYVAPIEGGMSKANLASNATVHTNFGAQFYGGHTTPTTYSVAAGGLVPAGTLTLPPDSLLVDSTGSVSMFHPGETKVVSLWGSGFTSGMSVWSESPYLSVGSVQNGSSWIQAQVTVAAGAPLGLYDLYFAKGNGEMEAASGVIDVHALPPQISGLDVALGPVEGGTPVTLSGSGFLDGAYVLFGGREAEAVQVVGPGTITVTAPAGSSGTVDVSVHNPDGQQARSSGAFTYASVPGFLRLFPEAGQSSGGTTLLVGGTNFAQEMVVLLDGQALTTTWLSPNVVQVTTPAHAVGAVDLALRNPSVPDVTVAEAYAFVALADPRVTGFTPTKSKDGGGIKVKLFGVNLGGADGVSFGIDPVTAEGGRAAAGLTQLGLSTLQVVAPAWRPGSYGIKVTMPNGQGVVAPATFQYVPEADSGAGGCGGLARRGGPRSGSTDVSALLLVAAGFLLIRRRRLP